jgi:two-component system, cell cycle sensor histidine kinase DivJ
LSRVMNFFRSTFDPYPSGEEWMRDRVYAFTTANFASGLMVLMILPVYIYLTGLPSLIVWIAFVWLMVPSALAFAPRFGLSLRAADTLSIINMTGLVTFLVTLTGGLNSFLIAWFVVIPIEASLSGRHRLTGLAIGLAGLGIAILYGVTVFGFLPESHVSLVSWPLLFTISTLAAMIYAGGVTMSVQRLHRRAEKDATAGRERYRFLADNALDMIIRHDPDGAMTFVSKASLSVLGYTPKEMLAFEKAALIHRADQKHVEIALSRCSNFGEDTTIEFRMRHKNGDYIWLEMRCRAVAVTNREERALPINYVNSLTGMVQASGPESHEIIAVARDNSKAKQYEQELIHARELAEAGSRSKLHFLANVSHELRTPLSAINGFSDIMKREMFGPIGNKRYVEYSQLIHSSGNHLLELINDLLDMSKIEAGKYSIDHESIFFPVIIENCLRLVRLQMERAQVKLHVDLPQSLPRIEADSRACKQILLNLLSNAIKFTAPGGSISISMYMDGDFQVLEVGDTGVGISETDLDRLGNPFEQVKGSSFAANDRSGAGTGLGLSLVRSLTELHGGHFLISSEVGQGTLIRILLPLVAPKGHDVNAPLPGIFQEVEPHEVGRPDDIALNISGGQDADPSVDPDDGNLHDAA